MADPVRAPAWQALSPELVAARIADLVEDRHAGSAPVRVAVDGAPCTEPGRWAEQVHAELRDRGRHAIHVPAQGFWRDRSLRFEYGREDVDSYQNWLDADALRREVLVPAASVGSYLPSLRDPASNRSTRTDAQPVGAAVALIVSGSLLFGLGLPFEVSVHLSASPAALRRRTPADEHWTLPAFDEYAATVDPAAVADVVVKVDDPRHPAVRGL